MSVCVIGCLYKDDIYSHHCYDLVKALERKGGAPIELVTSNCSCFSSSRTFGCKRAELLTTNCETVKIPYAPPDPSKKYGEVVYYLTRFGRLYLFFEIARGISFFWKTRTCEMTHFEQVLKSFGFLSFLTFMLLAKKAQKKVMVTVHELDPLQVKYKRLNEFYNRTDKIIVHSSDLKNQLVELGTREEKVEIVPYGVSLEELDGIPRDQFIFFGGHKLLKGKGFDTLLNALRIVQARGKKLKLVIYTGEGCIGLDEGKKKVRDMGLDKSIRWSEFLHRSKLAEAYQKSIACIVPYTGGSARYPATSAMANATPVIGTRKASLPEYIRDLGIYVEEDSPEHLAECMIDLMDHPEAVISLGQRLRQRAEERFSWDRVAGDVLRIYEEVASACS